MKCLRIIAILLSLALLAACGSAPEPAPADEPQMCAQDVQECADGSFVARDPANSCEFRACPAAEQPAEPAAEPVTDAPAAPANESDEIYLGNIPDLLQSLDILDAIIVQYESACGPEIDCDKSDISKEYAAEDITALDGIISVLSWYDEYYRTNPSSTLSFSNGQATRAQEADIVNGALADAKYVRDMLMTLVA